MLKIPGFAGIRTEILIPPPLAFPPHLTPPPPLAVCSVKLNVAGTSVWQLYMEDDLAQGLFVSASQPDIREM